MKPYSVLQVGAFTKCTNCHATTLVTATARNGAPFGVDFDLYLEAQEEAQMPYYEERLNDGTMPPPGFPALVGTERDDLLLWAACGTPP